MASFSELRNGEPRIMNVADLTEVEERHSRKAIEAEIVRFEERAQQLQSGAITAEQFRPFRLKHGTYGQRQPGFQMLRVKIAAGVLSPSQLRVLADIADEYSTGRGHLTTRENVQFHFVKLENVGSAMRLLADAGLTTREACGNTVRNVTACPVAGICPGEAFDVTPYALGVSRYLLRHPDFHDLPRKFKIAFSGCEDDGAWVVAEKRKVSQAPAESFTVPSPIRPSLVTIAPAPLATAVAEPQDGPEYDRWAEHNLMSQRQAGYGAIWIKLPAGTFHSNQMRGLADVLEKNELSGVRIAVNQDLVIPWVPFDRARAIYDELRGLDLAIPGARTISDVTGCPGATTCNLGITRSLTLADVRSRELDGYTDPEIQKF